MAKPPVGPVVFTHPDLVCSLRQSAEGLDRVDIDLSASGLNSFEEELRGAHEYDLDGIRVKVLPLERVIVSKRAANRAKDAAQVPMLEAALTARRARGVDSART